MHPLLEINDVVVAYNSHRVIHGVSFGLSAGAIGCLLGPSGCGKTTLLRVIAGFEPVQEGRVSLAGETVSRPAWRLPPERRRVGMVFQDYALFPHLTVGRNIGFGIKHWHKQKRSRRIHQLLELVGLSAYVKSYPHQLSGGQQQRVALARALAPKPKLLLLDEPFSSMDVDLREAIAHEVRSIIKKEAITSVLVTHDQLEAFAMADEIGVMKNGKIMQWDTGYNLYHRPNNRFIADFVGQGVFLSGAVVNEHQVQTELGIIDGALPRGCSTECDVEVLVRPDDLIHDESAAVRAEVTDRAFRGAEFLYELRLPSGARLLILAPSHDAHEIGEQIGIRPDFAHLVVFPKRT